MKEIIKRYFSEENGFGKNKQIAINLLKKTIEILDELNIKHFLISGTLLGYTRHNDFIPWDDDMDLLVEETIIDKVEELTNKHKDTIVVLSKASNMIRFCFKDSGIEVPGEANGWKDKILTENGVFKWPFIDLFTYKSINDKIYFFKKTWDADKFFPADAKKFVGLDVFVPKDPDYFLKLNYGKNYMNVLKSSRYSHKDERLTHNKIITMQDYQEFQPLSR